MQTEGTHSKIVNDIPLLHVLSCQRSLLRSHQEYVMEPGQGPARRGFDDILSLSPLKSSLLSLELRRTTSDGIVVIEPSPFTATIFPCSFRSRMPPWTMSAQTGAAGTQSGSERSAEHWDVNERSSGKATAQHAFESTGAIRGQRTQQPVSMPMAPKHAKPLRGVMASARAAARKQTPEILECNGGGLQLDGYRCPQNAGPPARSPGLQATTKMGNQQHGDP